MNKLLIYEDINNLDFESLQNEYDLIITSYRETTKLLEGKMKAVSIGDIIEYLFSMWNNKEEDYNNIVQMRNLLEDSSNYFSKEILDSFSKSIKPIYKSIKIAKELRITPEEYKKLDLTLEQKMFLKLIEKVYIQDSFINFDLKLFEYDQDINKFIDSMNEYFKNTLDLDCFYKSCKKKILIQGFYYISPVQELVLDYFKKSGLEIIPMICYDKRYTEVNKIIENTFNSIDKHDMKESITYKEKGMYISDLYASILDGRGVDVSDIIDVESVNFKHYNDLNLYNKDLLKVLDEYSIDKNPKTKAFGVNKKEIVDRISIFRGNLENPEKLSIKYYPLGIFLKEIYSTWDNKLGVCLSIELLNKIFESNFLQYGNYKSIDYIEDLNLISDYFLNCKTIDEWIKQISLLKNNKSNLSFMPEYDSLLNSYGPFSIQLSRLEIVEEYINRIKEITDIIFFDKKGNIDTKLIVHLKNLYDIIERNTKDEEDEDDKLLEHKLLNKIYELLESKSYAVDQKKKTAKNKYLFDAISLYVSHVKNYNYNLNDRVEIYSLDSIESIDKNIEEIHIYDFDREKFPKSKLVESKFIKNDILEEINKNREGGSIENRLIERHLNIIKNKDLIGRYIFWLILKRPKIKKNIYRLIELGKDNVHFYQRILENKLKKYSNKNIDENISIECKIKADLSMYKVNTIPRKIDDKSKYLYLYCPLRSYLSRINNDKEVYIENFSIEHFIPNLFANIYAKSNKSINANIEILNKNFNQYSKLALSRFGNIARSSIKSNYNHDDNFWLPKKLKESKNEIKGIEYLYGYFIHNIGSNNIKNIIAPLPNNGKTTCSFCSFKYICVEKNLNNNNYPSNHWKKNKENIEEVKSKINEMNEKIEQTNKEIE